MPGGPTARPPDAGLTALEALRTATVNPASFLGATDSLGAVKPGMIADLLLLEADPTTDIRHVRRIRTGLTFVLGYRL